MNTKGNEMNTLTITGYERECNCEHCGRPLKLGVKTAERGLIGADCFVKMIARDRARFNGNGKPSAEGVKQYALVIAKGMEYASRMYGYSARSFVFPLA